MDGVLAAAGKNAVANFDTVAGAAAATAIAIVATPANAQ